MNRVEENNQVTLSGEIASDFRFSHKVYGERFYIVDVNSPRISGVCDIIPVMVSERLVDVQNSYIGLRVCVEGQYRSYNRRQEDGNHLVLTIFAREWTFLEAAVDTELNHIKLRGYICKAPVYRETPLGRQVTDVMLAINRPYGKTDYIPCICWGRNAVYAGGLEVGAEITITGRVQSRQYIKRFEDGSAEERTVYEVSVSAMK